MAQAQEGAPQGHARGIAQEIASGTSNELADLASAREILHFDSLQVSPLESSSAVPQGLKPRIFNVPGRHS